MEASLLFHVFHRKIADDLKTAIGKRMCIDDYKKYEEIRAELVPTRKNRIKSDKVAKESKMKAKKALLAATTASRKAADKFNFMGDFDVKFDDDEDGDEFEADNGQD